MKTHILKTHSEPFLALQKGIKRFEFRYNDRNFEVGDTLILKEWLPDKETFTDQFIYARVDYISHSNYGIPFGYVCMSITARLKSKERK